MNHDKSGCNGVSVPLGNLLMVLIDSSHENQGLPITVVLCQDNLGKTALHWAASGGLGEACKAILGGLTRFDSHIMQRSLLCANPISSHSILFDTP